MFRMLSILAAAGLLVWVVLTSLHGSPGMGIASPYTAIEQAERVAEEVGARARHSTDPGWEEEKEEDSRPLPSGVVEILFETRWRGGARGPYAGPYQVLAADGEVIEEGDAPEDGSPVELRLNPGSYTVRAPGTGARSPFSIAAREERGKRVHLLVPGS